MIHGGMTFKNERDYLQYLKTKKVSVVSKPYWEADLEKKLKLKKIIFMMKWQTYYLFVKRVVLDQV